LAKIAIVVFVLHLVFLFSNVFHDAPNLHNIFGNVFIVVLSSLALISVIFVYAKFPENFPSEKRGNLFVLLGMLLFLIGDVMWLVDEIFLNNKIPIGGFADLFWNVGYVCFIVAIIMFISFSFRASNKILYWLMTVGVLIGGYVLYSDVSEDLELGSFTLSHAIQDVYILYDFIVLILIIYLVWPMILNRNRLFYSWIILAFGFLTRVVYDRIFANMSEYGTYYTGHPIDLLYIVFYMCVVFVSLTKFRIMSND